MTFVAFLLSRIKVSY